MNLPLQKYQDTVLPYLQIIIKVLMNYENVLNVLKYYHFFEAMIDLILV